MPLRTLGEAVFRLGQISAEQGVTNIDLVRRLADLAAEALGVDVAVLSVFDHGLEQTPCVSCVGGAGTGVVGRTSSPNGWQIDGRGLAQRLASLTPGRIYSLRDFPGEGERRPSRFYSDFQRPVGVADQAVGVFRRADGATLVVCLQNTEPHGQLSDQQLSRAQALAPFIAQCWAAGWRPEPAWLSDLKPQARMILEQLLRGCDDDQIAQRTGLSYHSVRAHLKRLFRDAGVRSRLHLMQACTRCPVDQAVDVVFQGPDPVTGQAVA